MSSTPEPATSPLIISGSARSDGNTAQAVRHLCEMLGDRATYVDLATQRIDSFRYGHAHTGDDFRSLISLMLRHRDIVFATPVYWYAMSGVLKTFFDRLTDLFADEESRRIGRELAGRDLWVLATGADESLPPGFEQPFARTAAYFGMRWRRAVYLRAVDGASLSASELLGVEQLAVELLDNA
ncbi:NAD(P)H-dependent oxidoreductase [Sphingomonas sp.]|jgi:multimeric flavodoxin WrbA|uniref:flavodoxin family protein n=1 Tax=Sphingomonas sp. TaxID=28214 RepID=UPI002E34BCCC|nr:NAD(P)H-dependent oxidoreductase [Sphingomonas sp.]HEX4693756.1 NAD(P)H-dependent oxidoreductase [Sphingomonas sp.]